MSERDTIGLDNPAFYGRLRQSDPRQLFASDKARSRVPARSHARPARINDVRNKPATQQVETVSPQPLPAAPQAEPALAAKVAQPQPRPQTYAEPAENRLRPSTVLKRPNAVTPRPSTRRVDKKTRRHSKLQVTLAGMAALVFMIGIAASIQTIKTNHQAAAQVAALAKKTNNSASGSGVVPATTKPSAAAVRNYAVAPNLPRYLKIPKLGVNARVMQVGVLASGALGTPSNVFDTAWYTGSAEPGQPGATLIDGHVSSWSTSGVFYGLKTMALGDAIQIVRGDGTIINYQVVKAVTYIGNTVNMQAAMTPVTPGISGLNLISCTGDVIPGTSLFNARIVVFAQEVSITQSH